MKKAISLRINEILNQSLNQERLSTRGIKLAVPTDLQILNFNNEILLNANT